MKLKKKDFGYNFIYHYWFYRFNGYEIAIEPCFNGFDVAIYKNQELLEEKKCTNLDLEKVKVGVVWTVALKFVNKFYLKYLTEKAVA